MRDIIFMGRVMASVTHEMQNVMAIIKESGALAEDIMALNRGVSLKHGDKLPSALGNIREQVERGRGLMQRLNGFAHAAEDFPENCDLTRFAEHIAVLAGRMAALRECSLRLDLGKKPVPVRGNAALIMQSLYIALSDALAICPKGSEISVSARGANLSGAGGQGAALHVSCPGASAPLEPGAELTALMSELGGSASSAPDGMVLAYQSV